MGHVDVNGVSFTLPDGRPLLGDVTFRVGEGATVALVGPNGTGKSTLLRIIAGDLEPHEGSVGRSGGLGVMRQFVGSVRDDTTVRDLLVSVAPPRVRAAAQALDAAELAMMETDDEPTQLRYAQALADWADAGGYEAETLWDVCSTAALGAPFDRTQYRSVRTLSGGEQKRLVLEALLRGPDDVLLLDEPDNYLDVPGKRWLEDRLRETPKTVLLVSHDRELLARAAQRIVTLEPGPAGATAWTHGAGFATYHQARAERNARLEELRRRWDEEHAKIKALVLMYKTKAAYNDGLASRYQAALTRLRKFEEAGPPQETPAEQSVTVRLRGGRTGKRAVVCEQPELTGRTLLDVLHRGTAHRDGLPREPASRALDRYELARAAEQTFDSLSGGQQARFQILLLELSGATLLLLDEPTDNLDVLSAEALEEALEAFEGTVLAVTHDRWFARSFDRFLVFGADGRVYESAQPVFEETRVARAR